MRRTGLCDLRVCLTDIVRVCSYASDVGVYNAVADQPVTNDKIMSETGKILFTLLPDKLNRIVMTRVYFKISTDLPSP